MFPIAETDKKPLAIFDVMVHAPDHLVLVSTGAGDRSEIVGERSVLLGAGHRLRSFAEVGLIRFAGMMLPQVQWEWPCYPGKLLGVHAASTRVINLIDYNGVAVGVLLAVITDTTR